MGKDYIDLAIDVDRMAGGKELAAKIRETDRGGIPWMAILDSEGNKLVTSDAPKTGNIGCPVQPEERAHFLQMIDKDKRKRGDCILAKPGCSDQVRRANPCHTRAKRSISSWRGAETRRVAHG